MNKVIIFDKALKYQNITKKEFAQKSNIPKKVIMITFGHYQIGLEIK